MKREFIEVGDDERRDKIPTVDDGFYSLFAEDLRCALRSRDIVVSVRDDADSHIVRLAGEHLYY